MLSTSLKIVFSKEFRIMSLQINALSLYKDKILSSGKALNLLFQEHG